MLERLEKIEAENAALREEVEWLKEDLEVTNQEVQKVKPALAKVTGYIDMGFFAVSGDGSGIRPDIGNVYFPEYAGVVPGSWVFMGDPLSTAINSRGDPADTADSRAIAFDPVDSRGKSSFLLNALNIQLFTGITPSLLVQSSFDLVPRSRNVSDPEGEFVGDYVDVKLAYLEYRPAAAEDRLSLFVGKLDSTVGREYRVQEADVRTTVTPSLLCRYVCGHPLGVKARLAFLGDRATAAAAVTNGSNFQETFDFADESDRNQFKTASGRVSFAPLPAVELGASGAFGAQDQQRQNDVYQWHLGADLLVSVRDVQLVAEYVQGRARGKTSPSTDLHCDLTPCIEYKSAYGLVSYRATNIFIPYVRVDWRDAEHENGASFVYYSQLIRSTAGLRLELGTHIVAKAEYTLNRELGEIPQFKNDVFASSMVVKF